MSHQSGTSQSTLPGLKNIQNNTHNNNQNTQNDNSQINSPSHTPSNQKKIFTYADISPTSRVKRSKDDNLDTYLPSTFLLDTSIPPSIYGNVPTAIVVLDWKSQFQLETKYKVKELQASQKHRRSLSLVTKSPSQQKKTILQTLSDVGTTSSNANTLYMNIPTSENSPQKENVATEAPDEIDNTENQRELLESSMNSYPEYEVRNLRLSYEETLKLIRKSQPDHFYDNFTMTKSSSDSNLTSHLHSDSSSSSIQLGESISNQFLPKFLHEEEQEPVENGTSSSSSSSSSKSSKKKKVIMLSKDHHSQSDSSLDKTSRIQKKKHGIFHVFTKLGRKNKSGSLPQQLQEVNSKISKDPNNLHLYLERARIHVQMGNIELAKHDYDLIQHPSPDMVVRTNNNN